MNKQPLLLFIFVVFNTLIGNCYSEGINPVIKGFYIDMDINDVVNLMNTKYLDGVDLTSNGRTYFKVNSKEYDYEKSAEKCKQPHGNTYGVRNDSYGGYDYENTQFGFGLHCLEPLKENKGCALKPVSKTEVATRVSVELVNEDADDKMPQLYSLYHYTCTYDRYYYIDKNIFPKLPSDNLTPIRLTFDENGHLISFTLSASLFNAANLRFDEFAQKFIENYDIPEMDFDFNQIYGRYYLYITPNGLQIIIQENGWGRYVNVQKVKKMEFN